MTIVTFFPPLHRELDLVDIISRASWFLTFCPIDRIDIPVTTMQLKQVAWRVADGMDESIARNFEILKSRVNFVLVHQEADLQKSMSEAGIILRWKRDSCPSFISGSKLSSWLKGKKVWEVDPVAVRMEGSFYIEVGLHLTANKPALIKDNKNKFDRLSKKLGKFDRAYLMATGPSISHYKKYKFDESINIVCNSVILDEALMQTVKPQILVFADPIFHFGPSQYAGAFRKSLVESAKLHDFIICMPFKYYGLFVSAVPELADRTIGIPFTKDRDWNLDLNKDFNLKTTANILTFLMVPLAGTFAKEIGFLGCDGRPLEENTYFWGHNEKTQINDKMANIREVHPGFFAIDYDEYYHDHCNTLEAQLKYAEQDGRKVFSLTFSHIPALKSRISRVWRSNETTPDQKPTDVFILDPDAIDYSGHFMAYNENLESALSSSGCRVNVFCNRNISNDILSSHPNYKPTLNVNSWSLAYAQEKVVTLNRCRQEILNSLSNAFVTGDSVLVYAYAGSIELASVLADACRIYPKMYVNVNLFWFSNRDLIAEREYVDRWRDHMDWIDQSSPRFIATVPTKELQTTIAQVYGVILEVAPHPSTAVPDSLLSSSIVYNEDRRSKVTKVLFPGSLRSEKGYKEALECSRLLGNDNAFAINLRYTTTTSTPEDLRSRPSNLPKNVTLIDGVLSNDDFRKMFLTADLVVLPYGPEKFSNRTSGLLIDSLAYGLPAVVVEGTWLANHVRKYGCGVIVPDSSAEALAEGVLTLVKEIDSFSASARSAAERYFSSNSWFAMADFLLKPFSSKIVFPKVAGIDLTSLGGISATSRVKDVFFRGWPKCSTHWISLNGETNRLCPTNIDGAVLSNNLSDDELADDIRKFKPDAVYYRAVDNAMVHAFASSTIPLLRKPYVVHLMDDWPRRLEKTTPVSFVEHDKSLRALISNANACLSIGDAMSKEFGQRYGRLFIPFANAVDPASFPPRKRVPKQGEEFLICYAGALAEDMTLTSVTDVANAVESLPDSLNVRLNIYTRPPWTGIAKRIIGKLSRTRILEQVPSADYYVLLQESDALLIAYNFDQLSRDYIGYSIANKMPECLASGTPIIAYGPDDVATIDYLKGKDVAMVVDQQNHNLLVSTIQGLVAKRTQQLSLGKMARELAFQRHNLWDVSASFRRLLTNTAEVIHTLQESIDTLLGPFGRSDSAHWDETLGVAEIFSSQMKGGMMIDVGGHQGSALMPFLNKGWKIFAFEPDEKNRAKLIERLAKHKNKHLVSLDTRCVGNKSQNGVSFFTSEQSTGISGLSAFHETHVEAQKVDITTLTEFFKDKPLPAVDFLKIDTEGHDLFVLQGFPWERCMPAVIECEFEDTKTVPLGYTFHDLACFLVDKGYTVYVSEWHPIIRYGIRHDWRQLLRYPCELADPKGWGNLLAFRQPIDEQALIASVKKVLKVGGGETAHKPLAQLNSAASAKSEEAIWVPGAKFSFCFELGAQFTSLAPNQWCFTDAEAKQKHWVAAINSPGPTVGRSFVGTLRVKADRAMTVNVSLGRHDKSAYEGASKRIRLAPDVPQIVKLDMHFKLEHQALKLQVEVVDLPGSGSVVLTIDGLGVGESLLCIRERVGASNFDLRTANRLFREGDYLAALGIYLWLSQQHTLSLYGKNAVRAAHSAGMRWVNESGDLAWISSSD